MTVTRHRHIDKGIAPVGTNLITVDANHQGHRRITTKKSSTRFPSSNTFN